MVGNEGNVVNVVNVGNVINVGETCEWWKGLEKGMFIAWITYPASNKNTACSLTGSTIPYFWY
jgi:hypothetical protein